MVSDIARFILAPFNILLFLIAGAIIFKYLNKSRIYKWMACSALLWFFLITTPFLPYLVLSSLENRYDPLFTEELNNIHEEYHIVVLGAGYSFNERFPANTQLGQKTLGRLVEGIRIFKQLPNSTLVTSGSFNNQWFSQAEVARNAAKVLGVPNEDILVLNEPRTTYEEANEYFEHHYAGQKVILVTSAAHMHRALSEFKDLGIDVIPSPANYTYRDINGMRFTVMPSFHHISNLRMGIYEYAALVRNYFR